MSRTEMKRLIAFVAELAMARWSHVTINCALENGFILPVSVWKSRQMEPGTAIAVDRDEVEEGTAADGEQKRRQEQLDQGGRILKYIIQRLFELRLSSNPGEFRRFREEILSSGSPLEVRSLFPP